MLRHFRFSNGGGEGEARAIYPKIKFTIEEPEGKIGIVYTAHRRLTEAINKDPTVGAAAGGDKRSFTPTSAIL